jgi:transposase
MSSNDVHPIKWPPGSPDFNPIENVWGLIKRKPGLEDPSKVAEWKDKINDLWVHLDFNYLESLIMRCRAAFKRASRAMVTPYHINFFHILFPTHLIII